VRDGLHWIISGRPQTPPPVYSEAIALHPETRTVADQLRQLAAVLDHDVIHVIRESHDTPPSTEQPVDAATTQAAAADIVSDIHIPPFDATKRVLSEKLCPGKHEWGTTGRTLLSIKNRTCQQCQTAGQ